MSKGREFKYPTFDRAGETPPLPRPSRQPRQQLDPINQLASTALTLGDFFLWFIALKLSILLGVVIGFFVQYATTPDALDSNSAGFGWIIGGGVVGFLFWCAALKDSRDRRRQRAQAQVESAPLPFDPVLAYVVWNSHRHH